MPNNFLDCTIFFYDKRAVKNGELVGICDKGLVIDRAFHRKHDTIHWQNIYAINTHHILIVACH
jgi:hypothetical protein